MALLSSEWVGMTEKTFYTANIFDSNSKLYLLQYVHLAQTESPFFLYASLLISPNSEQYYPMWSDPDLLGKLKVIVIYNAKTLPKVEQLNTHTGPLPILSASSNPSSILAAKGIVPT